MGIRNTFYFVLLMFVLLVPLGALAENEHGVMEISLRFDSVTGENIREAVAGEQDKTQRVSVIGKRSVSGVMPRQRNPELSSQHLVVVALDAQGHEISRQVMADPRSILAETFSPSGEGTSTLLINENVELSIVVPDDSGVNELHIYHPHWTGSEFTLELIAQTKMP